MSADQRLQDALKLLVKEPTSGPPEETDDPGVYPEDWLGFGHVDYFYRRNAILVRTADLDRVRDALTGDDRIFPNGVVVEAFAVIEGVTSLRWKSTSVFGHAEFEARYSRELARIRDARKTRESGVDKAARDHDDNGKDGKDGEGEGDGDSHGNDGFKFHRHTDDEWPLTTPWVLTELDWRLGVGVARPDTLLPLQDNGHPCPATEPDQVPNGTHQPTPALNTGRCDGMPGWDGQGICVGVVDNGLIGYMPTRVQWMNGVRGEPDVPATPMGGTIARYAGHGTFVAGCVRTTAPAADVLVKQVSYPSRWPEAGAAYESDVVQRMDELLDVGVDVIVCEFAGDTRFRLPLLTFEVFYDCRLRHLNVAVVAPAGNDSTRAPRYPAAFSWAVGVGALSADGRHRADFSNYGGWVDVYAPGEELVNAFAVGDYTCFEDPHTNELRHFDGLAKWSGTSFSTPLVAGMIAARMSATGENPVQATESLLQTALRQAVRGIGPVLRPGDECKTRCKRPSWLCRLLLRLAGCDCGCR